MNGTNANPSFIRFAFASEKKFLFFVFQKNQREWPDLSRSYSANNCKL